MPITERTCVKVSCCRCDEPFHSEYEVHFDSEKDIREAMTGTGWACDYGWRLVDGRFLCGDCWTYSDDEDREYAEAP